MNPVLVFENFIEVAFLCFQSDSLMFKERKLNIGPAVRKQQAFPRVYGTFSVLLCPLPWGGGGGSDNLSKCSIFTLFPNFARKGHARLVDMICIFCSSWRYFLGLKPAPPPKNRHF